MKRSANQYNSFGQFQFKKKKKEGKIHFKSKHGLHNVELVRKAKLVF